ncbi:MAG TPA: SBBP repeat-containing protein [Fimbriimonadales bacterium]|nr:SBBP repeat-containing protein [Fimbriimonadales bacterium]
MKKIIFKLFTFLIVTFGIKAYVVCQVHQEWVAYYTGAANKFSAAVATQIDSSGNIYVTGASIGLDGDEDIVLLKYSPTGTILWERRYDGEGNGFDAPTFMKIGKDGNIYVAGTSEGTPATYNDMIILKYTPTGDLVWGFTYDGTAHWNDIARSLGISEDGRVYVVGSAWNTDGVQISEDFIEIILTKDGTLDSVRLYGNTLLREFGVGIEVVQKYSTIERVVVGAQMDSNGINAYKIITAKGNWVNKYSSSYSTSEIPIGLAVDSQQNIYVVASSHRKSLKKWDVLSLKYNPPAGLLWERRYSRGDNVDTRARAMALDSSGNLYVLASLHAELATSNLSDYLLLKYDTNGVLKWAKTYDNGKEDDPFAIALDKDGNVYVTGRSQTQERVWQCATLKFSPSGNRIWVARYGSPVNNAEDNPRSISVSPSGMVIVTGYSNYVEGITSFFTLAYSQKN